MNEMVVEVIESFNAYLENLPNGCMYIANKLREDQVNEALVEIKNFAEGIIWMVDTVQILEKYQMNIAFNIEKAHEFLEEINEALQIQDYNLVADLFEYELTDYFSELENIQVN